MDVLVMVAPISWKRFAKSTFEMRANVKKREVKFFLPTHLNNRVGV